MRRTSRSALALAVLASAALLPVALAQEERPGFFSRLRQNLFGQEETAGTPPTAPAAQDAGQSQLVRFLERQLSTPERQVRIGEIRGLLSSEVSVASITVSDPEGTWLTLRDVTAEWNRTALLRGRLDIARLSAGRVSWVRRSRTSAQQDDQGSGIGFSLPLDVEIDSISLPVVLVGEEVVGQSAILGADGSVAVTSASVAANLDVRRLDGPGGTLTGRFVLQPQQNVLEAEAALSEPQGGLVAAIFDLPGRPALDFRLDGEGSLNDWRANVALSAGGKEALSGEARIRREGDSYRLTTDLAGALGAFAPEPYASFLSGESRLVLDAARTDAGAIEIVEARLTSDLVEAQAQARLAPDLFPQSAQVSARIGRDGGPPVGLPFAPGEARVASLDLTASLGQEGAGGWTAELAARGLTGDFGAVERLTLRGSGAAENLRTPSERRLTFDLSGEADGAALADPPLADALGTSLRIGAQGEWQAGRPVRIASSQVTAEHLTANFTGGATAERLDGRTTIEADDLSRFSRLAGRELRGSASLSAEGVVEPGGGLFDLTLDGRLDDVATGIAQLDALIVGNVSVTGGLTRTATGLRFDDFAVNGGAARLALSGSLDRMRLAIDASGRVANLSRLDARLGGAAALTAQVAGTLEAPRVALTAEGDGLILMGKPFADARLDFEGVVAGPQTAGQATLSGTLDGVPVAASARLAAAAGGARRLEDLTFTAGENSLRGDLTLLANGLLEGSLTIDMPDLATVGPLFLAEAGGRLTGEVRLAAENGSQSARVTAEAADLTYQDVRVGSGRIDLTASDLFSQPILEGAFRLADVAASGIRIPRVEGTARREGAETRFDLTADLAEGTARLAGTLTPLDAGGLRIALDALRLVRGDLALTLARPGAVTLNEGAVLLDGLDFAVGEGRVTLSGRLGAILDLTAQVDRLPTSLANAVAPQLDAQGLISGNLKIQGSAADPQAEFDIAWSGASFSATRAAGLGALEIAANGSLAERRVTFDADITGEPGVVLRAEGSVPLDGDGEIAVTADIERFPASLVNSVAPDLEARGIISGRVDLKGSLADPQGNFDIAWLDASLAVTRAAGVRVLNIAATGSLAERRVAFDANITGEPGIVLRAEGTAPLDGQGAVDLTATLDRVPAALANAVLPDLGAEGTIAGTLALEGSLAQPQGRFDVTWRNASLAAVRAAGVQPLLVEANGQFAEGGAQVEASVSGAPGINARVSGFLPLTGAGRLDVEATVAELPASLVNTIRPDLEAQGVVSGTLGIEGSLAAPLATFDLAWRNASLSHSRRAGLGALAVAARGRLADRRVTFDARISGAPGIAARAEGAVPLDGSGRIDLAATIERLPASLADAFAPGSGLQGTVSGTLALAGTLSAPTGSFDATWRDASSAKTRAAGLGGLTVGARGQFTGGGARIDASVTGAPGLDIRVSGLVPLTRAGNLDVTVGLTRAPLALANAFAPQAELEGTLSGTARIEGPLARPRVVFEAQGRNVSAAALRGAGIGPLALDARGRLADGRVQLDGSVTGAGGLGLTVAGSVPTGSAGRIDLAVRGRVPLGLADRLLADRGARLTGTLSVDVAVSGPLASPVTSGMITARGAGFVDPETGIALRDIALDARLSRERIAVERLTARSGDGTVSAAGSVGLSPAAGFPADLRVSLNNARYVDERLLAATLDGEVTITGPLTRMPTIGGTVNVERAEIAVPERLPGNAVLADVEHVHTPPAVLRTLELALPHARPAPDGEPTGVRLDLTVNAPARIFVRGRGLDAELGGSIRLTGPVSNVSPVGAFTLLRGRLDLLGQRITFDRGDLEFAGDLDPILDFQATARTNNITVTITVTGQASDPRIAFSSDPQLPEDEALAQLLFGRSLNDLSPFQILRLANAAADLGGLSQGGGLLGRLRATTGFDDLDVVVDQSGNPALQAGRYINENVYLGVRQGTGPGSTRVTIDLDVTKNVKARGELGADGGSSLGIFYEKEY